MEWLNEVSTYENMGDCDFLGCTEFEWGDCGIVFCFIRGEGCFIRIK